METVSLIVDGKIGHIRIAFLLLVIFTDDLLSKQNSNSISNVCCSKKTPMAESKSD